MTVSEETPAASPAGSSQALVTLSDVQKYYGDLHVLKDINLEVARGEGIVVIGPSGAGKSTLCRAINRLETISSGDITIDGKPLPQEGGASAVADVEDVLTAG